jgi:hypothetical protein
MGQDNSLTKEEYRAAIWSSHMDRLRANLAACREPGETLPEASEYLEPCEAGDSLEDELRKLITAGNRAYDEACLRAEKRVEAWDKLEAENGKA